MLTIPLLRGLVVVIDDEDADLVLPYPWRAVSRGRTFYAQRNARVGGRLTTQLMHTLITGYPMVDHVDGDGLNNRRANLRPATATQNAHNARKHRGSTSQYKGVSWFKPLGRWRAQIRVDGRLWHLGCFDSEIDAALTYDRAAREAFGEYARPNF